MLYTFNEEYKILKAYDPRSFILGLKEICNINIDMDKSYIGSMFSYQLLVDNEYVNIYDRFSFLDWIASKVDIEREGFYSYVTSLDYQIKIKNIIKKELDTQVDTKVDTIKEESITEKKTTRTRKTVK